MFNGFHPPQPPTDAELATQTLSDESSHRFPSFSANDAVTLGLSLRKRFRASSRHAKGKDCGRATLFACTVGDLGGIAGVGDVSLDSWACLEGDYRICGGGEFLYYETNAPCCPIAIVACYSGSSADDHHLVVNTVKDYIKKMMNNAPPPPPSQPETMPTPQRSHVTRSERSEADRESISQRWMPEPRASTLMQGTDYRSEYSREYRDEHELGDH
ncbi:hypothetical protein BC629DRAFT_1545324 [Irpex lacteus]|nr:hypothetical protein BC629DRAFT_1545324 [Irpex lacteus]